MSFNLLPEEHIKKIYRQHSLFWFKYLLLIAVVDFGIFYFIINYDVFSRLSKIFAVIVLGTLIFFAKELYIWSKNIYAVTNKRLVVMHHDGLFKKTVIETPLERILNVSYRLTGSMSVLFGFGDVEVQVVGLVEPVILKHIPQPEAIKDYLWLLHKRYIDKQITYQPENISHYQEDIGYTKNNQKIL